jgi:recombinational DNA repair protein RecT
MKDSPAWTKSFDAMARKTAIWELLKLLPKSAELRAALSSDDRAVMFNSLALEDRSAPALVAGDGLAFGDEDLDARDEDPDAAAAEAYVREHQGVIDTDEREVPDDIDPETGERLPLGGEGA